ncbi:hypothetical protein FA366_18510, partial [Pseudomonas aeruginosa]|nr:hypothetical protein [Pseudomonas aeruginosa]
MPTAITSAPSNPARISWYSSGTPRKTDLPGPPSWRAAPLSARRRLLALPFVPPTPLLRRLSPRKALVANRPTQPFVCKSFGTASHFF